jgi:hypothetical protein
MAYLGVGPDGTAASSTPDESPDSSVCICICIESPTELASRPETVCISIAYDYETFHTNYLMMFHNVEFGCLQVNDDEIISVD